MECSLVLLYLSIEMKALSSLPLKGTVGMWKVEWFQADSRQRMRCSTDYGI